jgi:hypothetical protein
VVVAHQVLTALTHQPSLLLQQVVDAVLAQAVEILQIQVALVAVALTQLT